MSIDVKDKRVVVIGGGDTGTDCVGTAVRRGCRSVTQFEIMASFPERVLNHDEWLHRGRTFQVDYGQAEAIELFGADPRRYEVLTKRFVGGEGDKVIGLETVRVEWVGEGGRKTPREIAGTEKFWKAEVVFLAAGFVGAERGSLAKDLGVEFTDRGTIAVGADKRTSAAFVFAAGDCERGQSLVVWAIMDGRNAARGAHRYLQSIGGELKLRATTT